MKSLVVSIAVTVLTAVSSVQSYAQASYPDRPITLIVPFASGGTTDVLGRLVAKSLVDQLKQPVIVENKPGAGGVQATRDMLKVKPDGYTIVLGASGSLTVRNAVAPKTTGYDTINDFTPVMLIAKVPLTLVVAPSNPAKTMKEFVAIAKARPGELSRGSSGIGTTNDLVGQMFENATGTKMTHLPYKSSGPALTDLMGGHVASVFEQVANAAPLIKEGRLHALGVTSGSRSPQLPDVPTMAELGIPIDVETFYAILLPKGAPPAVTKKLNEALAAGMAAKSAHDTFEQLGLTYGGGSPDDLRTFLIKDAAQWKKVATESGINID